MITQTANAVQVWTIPVCSPTVTVSKPAQPVPWLSDDEQRAWRAFVLATQLLLDQLDHELQRDAGMSHAYYGILVVLSEQPGRFVRMTDLARLLRYSKTRLSEAVARLEARGWVRREPCPTDRRSTYAVLTDEGLVRSRRQRPDTWRVCGATSSIG